jgi:peptide/nickel transport system substrate-binding protein
MKKTISIALVLGLMLLTSMFVAPAFAAPTINRPMEIIQATIEGGTPETVDPAWSYDTASAEIIMQVYEPLIVFDGEHIEQYLPAIATDWTIEPISETSPEGLTWNYRYTFAIRTGVQWHDPTYGTVTPQDVEYSIERGMVQDRHHGPQWMIYEPLLNTWGSHGLGYNVSIPSEAAIVGQMIDHAVESNATHVWFNIAFPGIYAPFMQVLSQIWGGIFCQAWIQTEVIGNLGRPDWDGVWGDYTGWVAYNDQPISPLDDPTPVMMGCGPFVYGTLDYTLEQWDVNRFVNYWRGWPIDWPAMAGAQPAGYIDHFVVTWAFDWPAREALFLAGDVDYCAVPRMFAPSIIGQDGIRLIWPLPNLACDGIFYNFVIDPTTPYGPILPDGTFDESGIPADFFGNDTWGVHTRKGFTLAFDYATFLSVAYLGEGAQPETAVIPGLPYYDPTIVGYPEIAPDAVAAENEFKMVPGLWDTGFTITVLYNEGNLPRQTAAEIMKSTIEALNPKFHVNVVSTDWRTYIIGAIYGILTSFIIGWLADYPDAHNFAFAFYHTFGTFSGWQSLSNPTMDALIDAGIAAPEGPGRQAIYTDIQQEAIDYCPSVIILQPIGRHFERDWMSGWYYNVISPGQYPANHWKWYYVEEALESTAAQPYSSREPVDVNYDGKVDMRDIGTTAASFGATYGPPLHPRWVFRADINCDRKIDMKDIGLVAKNFGATSPIWVAPP